jgi:hypothetical protein
MEENYRNKNRGYQQLRVWHDAVEPVESLERKQEAGDWVDSLIIKESNVTYG